MARPGGDNDDALEIEQEFAFADVNDRLPWLESDDDDDDAGVETGRMVVFAVVGLLAIVLMVGTLWWLTREQQGEALVADGSTIEAPPGPYKVKPADPGGRQVAGTGDTSFAVAEGREVEGRIAEAPAPRPSVDVKQPAAKASATPAASGGIGVQVGAYSSRAQAEAGWGLLSSRLSPLSGRSHRVVEGMADSGTVFRLQAVAGSMADADSLCRSIKAAGGDCQVKRAN